MSLTDWTFFVLLLALCALLLYAVSVAQRLRVMYDLLTHLLRNHDYESEADETWVYASMSTAERRGDLK